MQKVIQGSGRILRPLKVIQGRVLGFGWVCYAGVMARSCGRILVARQNLYGNEPSP